jgi:hypothetical protein
MHEAAGSCIDAPKNAAAKMIDMPILLTITPFYSTIGAVRRMHPYFTKIRPVNSERRHLALGRL